MVSPKSVLLMLGAVSFASCTDPMHDEAVDALGPEDPKVHPGPLHRPGQPCLTCHGGDGPGSPNMIVGGTTFALKGAREPLAGAIVQLTDATGHIERVSTNAAGNFWLTTKAWAPVFPMRVKVTYRGTTTEMKTYSGRSGDCNGCHRDPVSNESPGHVYLVKERKDLP